MTYNSQKTRIYWLKSPIHDEITLVSDTHKFHRLPYSKFRDSSICVTRPFCMRDFALSIILENVSCEVPWLIYMCDTTHLYARVCSVFVLEQVFCLGKIIQNTFFSNECAGLHTATHCSTVLCTATHYCILQHIPTHCNPSLHTAIHCDLHCDTFLYTATPQHSNTATQQHSKTAKIASIRKECFAWCCHDETFCRIWNFKICVTHMELQLTYMRDMIDLYLTHSHADFERGIGTCKSKL